MKNDHSFSGASNLNFDTLFKSVLGLVLRVPGRCERVKGVSRNMRMFVCVRMCVCVSVSARVRSVNENMRFLCHLTEVPLGNLTSESAHE